MSLSGNFSLGQFRPKKYKNELLTNSDFKKFDETLRMVIDCKIEQCQKIEDFFEKLKIENKISYGLHKSSQAIMTCMVTSATTNKHIHFMDGADGGYALAASQMKKSSLQ